VFHRHYWLYYCSYVPSLGVGSHCYAVEGGVMSFLFGMLVVMTYAIASEIKTSRGWEAIFALVLAMALGGTTSQVYFGWLV
jgi:xanthine/uracil permease